MLAFALQQVKMKYRSGITQTQGYLPHVVMFGLWKHWIQIISRLNSLEGSDDFACVCVEFRFLLLFLLFCLRFCLRHQWKPFLIVYMINLSLSSDCIWNMNQKKNRQIINNLDMSVTHLALSLASPNINGGNCVVCFLTF